MTTLLAQAAEVAGNGETAETVLFWVLSIIGLGAGIAMITRSNIIHSALLLVVNFFAIAGLYLTLQSAFLSIVQIIVYAGAIMVLFLFVIMLLGVDRDDLLMARGNRWQQAGAGFAGLVMAGLIVSTFVGPYTGDASKCGDQRPDDAVAATDTVTCVGLEQAVAANEDGAVGIIAERMFTRYTLPFELSGVLLTVATIGAMVLGKRNDDVLDEDDEVAADPTPLVDGDDGLDDDLPEGAPVDDHLDLDAVAAAGADATREVD